MIAKEMIVKRLMDKHAGKMVKVTYVALIAKSVAGVSITSISGFNVIAEQTLHFEPTISQEGFVGLVGAAIGAVLAGAMLASRT